MWVERLQIENIRCFDNETLRFGKVHDKPCRWITLLSENGGGKSTVLQALGLLLSGPESAQGLLKPLGWVRDESKPGRISITIHQDEEDPGKHGSKKVRQAFAYSFSMTGSKPLTINNKAYTEPAIVPAGRPILTWLRSNAFTSKGGGWFAAGYGAFRRLTRTSQIIVPLLSAQGRASNFKSQFDEDEPLSLLEQWMTHLDYRIEKDKDQTALRQRKMGVQAINKVLPSGAKFNSVTSEGRILFSIGDQVVPTIGMSDGYRSILAFVGDLVWRLLLAFPNAGDPLKMPGVVLIDELDIHLHPAWQRVIPEMLQEIFPRIQFFVATHSPLIAAGAGEDALTLKLDFVNGKSTISRIDNISSMSMDRLLQNPAFGLVSTVAPVTQRKISRYDELARKHERSDSENAELQELIEFMSEARPLSVLEEANSLVSRIDKFLAKSLP